MTISAARIFHVNSNCTDLQRSLAFYRDLLGLCASTHPLPDRPQPGMALGLDEALWDGWILQGDLGYGGLSLDLLEWKVPLPGGKVPQRHDEPGFHHLTFSVVDLERTVEQLRRAAVPVVSVTADQAIVTDPDGITVYIVAGTDRRISRVTINCRDLKRSVGYYRQVMGLIVVEEPSGSTDPQRAVFRDRGSSFEVELMHFPRSPMPAIQTRRANDVGLFRMAFSTDDCAGDEAVVRAAGSVPFAPTSPLSVGDHLPLLQVLFWPGPDGECLELIQVPGSS